MNLLLYTGGYPKLFFNIVRVFTDDARVYFPKFPNEPTKVVVFFLISPEFLLPRTGFNTAPLDWPGSISNPTARVLTNLESLLRGL